jgi:hypothetical protein
LVQFEEAGVETFYEGAFVGKVVPSCRLVRLGFDVLGGVFEAEEKCSRVFDILWFVISTWPLFLSSRRSEDRR